MDVIRKGQERPTLAQIINGQQRVCFIIEFEVEVPNWRDKTGSSHVHKAVCGLHVREVTVGEILLNNTTRV